METKGFAIDSKRAGAYQKKTKICLIKCAVWQGACDCGGSMRCISFLSWPGKRILSVWLPWALAPWTALATVSATLSWTPSPNSAVAGYKIYYWNANQRATTNILPVGAVTKAVVPGLKENTTYFFAATSCDSAGHESPLSNQAAFAGLIVTPEGNVRVKATPDSTNDECAYSLAGAPAGATINASNGVISWTPGYSYASTTNFLNVLVTDNSNPALSLSETFVVMVTDFLEIQLGAISVGAGQSASLPVTLNSSSTVTNVQITVDWPAGQLKNPVLKAASLVRSSSLQSVNNQLVIQLQTDGSALSGTNVVAQVNFQPAASPASVILPIPVAAASGSTADGKTYDNVQVQPGEVVVVGDSPMLRSQVTAGASRALSLYANPGNYQLLYTTSLVPPVTWMPLMNYQQTNIAQTVSLDATEPVIFYRLQQL